MSLKTGMANLPMELRQLPPLRLGHCLGGKGNVLPLLCPDSVAFWAVFQPLFEQLFAPSSSVVGFRAPGALRTSLRSGRLWTRSWMPSVLKWTTSWQSCATELGGGRSRTEQLAAQQRLLEQLAAQASVDEERATGPHGWRPWSSGTTPGPRADGSPQVRPDQAAGEDPERVI